MTKRFRQVARRSQTAEQFRLCHDNIILDFAIQLRRDGIRRRRKDPDLNAGFGPERLGDAVQRHGQWRVAMHNEVRRGGLDSRSGERERSHHRGGMLHSGHSPPAAALYVPVISISSRLLPFHAPVTRQPKGRYNLVPPANRH